MPSLTEEQKRELTRLIELKKLEEAAKLSTEEEEERKKLNQRYPDYALLKADELETELNNTAPTPSIAVKGSDIELIIDDYKKQFEGQPGYKEPETKDGMTKLYFETEDQANDFMLAQAQKNRSFQVFDSQMRLIAYSKGEGRLHHPDGSEFKKGDARKPQAGVSNQRFMPPKQPSPESAPSTAPVPSPFSPK